MAGLNPHEVDETLSLIRKIREEGITLFVVEHHMGMVMEIADQVAVLDNGRLIAEGPPTVVERDAQVMDAYLKRKSRNA